MRQLERNQFLRKVKRFYRILSRRDRDLFLQIPKSTMYGLGSLFSNDLVGKYLINQRIISDFIFRRNMGLLSKHIPCDIEGDFQPSMRFHNTSSIHIIGHHLGFALAETAMELKKINLTPAIGIPHDWIIIDECKNMMSKKDSLPPVPEIFTLKNLNPYTGTYLIDLKKEKKPKEIDRKNRYNYAKFRKK